jgi:hypothetical protein
MARIQGGSPEEAGVISRALFGAIRKQMGRLMETWPIVAHAPSILRGWAAFEWFLDRSRRVDAKLKRLACLKVSVMIGCPG